MLQSAQLKTNAYQLSRRLLKLPLVQSLAFPHDVDRYLEQINPLWSVTQVKARVTAVHHGTTNSVTLTLQPNANWLGFKPGQYVQLTVDVKGVRRTRCYSLANSAYPQHGQLELTVRAQDKGLVSQYLKQHATQGQLVELSQAQGDFCLPENRPRKILLMSAGSGITPMMAMLRTLGDENYDGELVFLHYCSNPRFLHYADVLEQYERSFPALKVIRIFTQSTSRETRNAHFSLDQLKALVPDYASFETYLCGAQGLMDQVEPIWREQNISDLLHKEQFVASTPLVPEGDLQPGIIQFSRSGHTISSDGRSLLELAEGAGITPESGCRMGVCATCTCKKAAGIVFNRITGTYSTEPNEDIRICISVPVGDVVLNL